MDADVEHNAGGTHALAVQHAHMVAGVFEVAEFEHELLGVECPTFAVSGDPADVAAPVVEEFAAVGGGGDLEVVAGDAFVEDRGCFGPGGEGVFADGNGPPHAAGPGEVVGGAGVVDAAFVGGGNHAFEGFHDVRDVEVDVCELGYCAVRELLHPRLQGVRSLDLAGGIVVEDAFGFFDAGAGLDLRGYLFLFADEPFKLLDAPGIRFFQIDFGANK